MLWEQFLVIFGDICGAWDQVGVPDMLSKHLNSAYLPGQYCACEEVPFYFEALVMIPLFL